MVHFCLLMRKNLICLSTLAAGFSIDSVNITTVQSIPTLIAGTVENITFMCIVKVLCSGTCDNTNVTFMWLKDGAAVFVESLQEVTLSEISTIHQETAAINREIAVDDAGSYHCQAELSEMSTVDSSIPQNISVTSK